MKINAETIQKSKHKFKTTQVKTQKTQDKTNKSKQTSQNQKSKDKEINNVLMPMCYKAHLSLQLWVNGNLLQNKVELCGPWTSGCFFFFFFFFFVFVFFLFVCFFLFLLLCL